MGYPYLEAPRKLRQRSNCSLTRRRGNPGPAETHRSDRAPRDGASPARCHWERLSLRDRHAVSEERSDCCHPWRVARAESQTPRGNLEKQLGVSHAIAIEYFHRRFIWLTGLPISVMEKIIARRLFAQQPCDWRRTVREITDTTLDGLSKILRPFLMGA